MSPTLSESRTDWRKETAVKSWSKKKNRNQRLRKRQFPPEMPISPHQKWAIREPSVLRILKENDQARETKLLKALVWARPRTMQRQSWRTYRARSQTRDSLNLRKCTRSLLRLKPRLQKSEKACIWNTRSLKRKEAVSARFKIEIWRLTVIFEADVDS